MLIEDHSLVALLVRLGEMSTEEAEELPELARLTRHVGMEGVCIRTCARSRRSPETAIFSVPTG
jgi:hypothetical protein